jgi:hypothetical protein
LCCHLQCSWHRVAATVQLLPVLHPRPCQWTPVQSHSWILAALLPLQNSLSPASI